jgi:K+-sensing histidine kinase KdpD
MREAFMGILSHELRTPVTTILAGSKVLGRRHQLPEATRDELIKDIEAEAERLYRLVEDLLVLARFEEHPPDAVASEPLLLQRILPALLASEEGRWPGRRFVLSLPTGLPTVSGDRTYVDQVVRNLLGNAAKYSPAEEAVEVAVDEEGARLNVRILDRGPGIAEDEAERLFELYYRSPGTLGIAAGAGIGLFVCRRLIEAMGGEIWARPRDGGGAEFGFALRVLDEEEV